MTLRALSKKSKKAKFTRCSTPFPTQMEHSAGKVCHPKNWRPSQKVDPGLLAVQWSAQDMGRNAAI